MKKFERQLRGYAFTVVANERREHGDVGVSVYPFVHYIDDEEVHADAWRDAITLLESEAPK